MLRFNNQEPVVDSSGALHLQSQPYRTPVCVHVYIDVTWKHIVIAFKLDWYENYICAIIDVILDGLDVEPNTKKVITQNHS